MKISIKEGSIVRPAKETPQRNLWISDLDIIVSQKHMPLVVFFENKNNSSNFFETKVLKDALSEVLVAFYPLAGRLSKDENGRTQINCNGKGALFIEAESTSVVDDFGDFTPSSDTFQLVPSFDSFSVIPLFGAQLTRFRCGSVCIGVCLHHAVTDGISAAHFFNSWSEVARGLSIAITPFIDRTPVKARVPPTPTFHHIEYDPRPTLMNSSIQSHDSKTTPPTTTKTFKITLDYISALESKFKNGVNYSSHEILSAHIWYCVCKARGLSNDQVTNLYFPTNGRFRLVPPLSSGFLGNVQFSTVVTCSVAEIQLRPLEETIEKIHLSLKKMDNKYLRSALDCLKTQPDLTVFRTTNTYLSPNLDIVNWSKMPLYAGDFGWGKPIHMGRAIVSFEGMAYINSTPNNDKSLVLVICLESDHMERFASLFYDFTSIFKGHSNL